jgi:hypothetical protein
MPRVLTGRRGRAVLERGEGIGFQIKKATISAFVFHHREKCSFLSLPIRHDCKCKISLLQFLITGRFPLASGMWQNTRHRILLVPKQKKLKRRLFGRQLSSNIQ